MQHAPRRRSGFTLIEIMIVVVILGILASTVLPQFSMSQKSAQEAAMVTSLNLLRSQVQLYRLEHNGTLPTAAINTELTTRTNISGGSTGTTPFGPYVQGQLPANPLCPTPGAERLVKTSGTPDGSTGWFYDTVSGIVKPGNNPSGDPAPSGKLFSEF